MLLLLLAVAERCPEGAEDVGKSSVPTVLVDSDNDNECLARLLE